MKKNWISIVTVAIFICANIATFLFAQGKVKIVEKIVTVYKNAEDKQAALPADLENSKVVGLAKAGVAKDGGYDFNDLDYFIDEEYDAVTNEEEQFTDAENDALAEENTPVNESIEPAKDAATISFGIDRRSEFSNTFPLYNIPYENSYTEPENPYTPLADETIPVPQLPLFDTDFEVDADFGGYEDILLPALPDMS